MLHLASTSTMSHLVPRCLGCSPGARWISARHDRATRYWIQGSPGRLATPDPSWRVHPGISRPTSRPVRAAAAIARPAATDFETPRGDALRGTRAVPSPRALQRDNGERPAASRRQPHDPTKFATTQSAVTSLRPWHPPLRGVSSPLRPHPWRWPPSESSELLRPRPSLPSGPGPSANEPL